MAGVGQHAQLLPPDNSTRGRKRAATSTGTKTESGLEGVADFFSSLLDVNIIKPAERKRAVSHSTGNSAPNLLSEDEKVDEDVGQLRVKVAEAERIARQYKQSSSQLAKENATQMTEITRLKELTETQQYQVAQLRNEKREWKLEMSAKTERITKLEEESEKTNATVKAQRGKLSEAERQLSAVRSSKSQLAKAHEELETKHNELDATCKKAQEELQALKSEADTAHQILLQLQLDLAAMREENEKLAEQTTRLNDENDQIFSDLRVGEQDVYIALDEIRRLHKLCGVLSGHGRIVLSYRTGLFVVLGVFAIARGLRWYRTGSL